MVQNEKKCDSIMANVNKQDCIIFLGEKLGIVILHSHTYFESISKSIHSSSSSPCPQWLCEGWVYHRWLASSTPEKIEAQL